MKPTTTITTLEISETYIGRHIAINAMDHNIYYILSFILITPVKGNPRTSDTSISKVELPGETRVSKNKQIYAKKTYNNY